MYDDDPNWRWIVAVGAVGMLVLAFANGAFGSPAIAVPAWIDQSGDNIGVPDIPRPRAKTGGVMLWVQTDFAGEIDVLFYVGSEPIMMRPIEDGGNAIDDDDDRWYNNQPCNKGADNGLRKFPFERDSTNKPALLDG